MSLVFTDFRIRQRDYLLTIARALVSRLNLRAVLQLILQAAVDLLQGGVGVIALRNEDGTFSSWASYGLPPALIQAFDPLVAEVPETADPTNFAIPNLADKVARIAEETGLLLRQVVALPLVEERALVGVIFVFRSHSGLFSPDDRQILASFADYAAIAVHNARLYEAAVTERRRLDALVESIADGVLVLRPDLSIERINSALATLTGWPAADVVGRPHDDIMVLARLDSGKPLSQAVAGGWPGREGRPLYVEGELRRRNGSLVSVGITYAPLLAAGRILNIIGNVREITRFRQADALKDTFISIVSHELKTPVAVIKGYAETLSRSDALNDPALAHELLATIVEESDRLARLVDDLLDASRLQAGGLPFQDVEEVDLREIARRVVERYQPQATRHSLRLEFPEPFPTVRGDARRLEQVLDNLVSNAIKYSPRGGDVVVQGAASPAEVTLSVSDQGVGIPLEEQERIFERFYRVEGPETRAVAGTGLGLYLTRAIVRAHGGRIWVQSAPGQGATFYVAIPRETGLALRTTTDH
jgi:PAS domain S-box-containing protein